MEALCQRSKQVASQLSTLTTDQKTEALEHMALQLEQHRDAILAANQKDVDQAMQKDLSAASIDRLRLDQERVSAMVDSIRAIAQLPDPVSVVLDSWSVPSGLKISRISVPLGVIAIIYESRPNVTADAAALCLKSGNAVILRGGSESVCSNRCIADCLQRGLDKAGLPPEAVQLLPSQDREAVDELLAMDQYVDVLIPRGGASLIQRVREKSRIPVFSHLQGICHTYIHAGAALPMAKSIVLNAKMRRTGICGATETLLIDNEVAQAYLPEIINALIDADCEVKGDAMTQAIDTRVAAASDQDWLTEYLDAIISIKVVDGLDAAVSHINQCGSGHTEAIITDDDQAAQRFLSRVNSAIVMHNCSTQFADGGEFGMGAEMGIATGKLHARGPIGVAQLCTFKYVVEGQGHLRP